MDLVDQVVNGAVVAAVGFLVWWSTRGRFSALEERIDGRFEEVERRLDRIEERLDNGLNAVRSDLTRVALAVGAQSESGAG